MNNGIFGDGSCLLDVLPALPSEMMSQSEFDAFITYSKQREAQREQDAKVESECRSVVEQVCADELLYLSAKSPGTIDAYLVEIKNFVGHCNEWGATAMPASPAVVAAYLIEKAGTGAGAQTLRKISAALGYWHALKDQIDPTEHPYVKATIRKLRKETTKEYTKNGKAH